MKAKFTPGPWTIDPSMEWGVAVIQDNEDGEGIAELGPQRTIENIANAKLIAAAPDLLGVLKDIVYTWENFNVNRESQMGEAIQYAKEAIKKAGAE